MLKESAKLGAAAMRLALAPASDRIASSSSCHSTSDSPREKPRRKRNPIPHDGPAGPPQPVPFACLSPAATAGFLRTPPVRMSPQVANLWPTGIS